MENLKFEDTVTLRQAYLIMFDYLETYSAKRNNPDELAALLGNLSLWNSTEGKNPMDGSVFPNWLKSAQNVLRKEQSEEGYRNADIDLS